jgi:hypothetical protein
MAHAYDDDGDDPLAREDVSTRKAARLDELRDEVRNDLGLALWGVALVGMAAALGGYTVATLRRGWMDTGESIVQAGREPGWFYGFTASFAAMALLCGVIGVQMLLHALKVRRRTARLAERIRRVK